MLKYGTEHKVQPHILMLESKITCKILIPKCKCFMFFNHKI